MKIETLVYIYAYICVCVLVFDMVYLVRTRYTRWIVPRRVARMRASILRQIRTLADGQPFDPRARRAMTQKLVTPAYLIAYTEALRNIMKEDWPIPQIFWEAQSGEFLFLAYRYQDKSPEYRAYFAYVVSFLGFGPRLAGAQLEVRVNLDGIAEVMLGFLESGSVYVRENACKALYSLGSARKLVLAVRALNSTPEYLIDKLLSEGLLTFCGDHAALAGGLWREFDTLRPAMQVVILNYLRLLPQEALDQSFFFSHLYEQLARRQANKEVRLAILRYFRKYPYAPVYEALLRMVREEDEQDWEYAAIAASALSVYPGEETLRVLTRAASSPNWYIRFNAAETLVSLGVDCGELITENTDSYAKGMLQYRSDINRLKGKKGLGYV